MWTWDVHADGIDAAQASIGEARGQLHEAEIFAPSADNQSTK